jgi:hypothetical protein
MYFQSWVLHVLHISCEILKDIERDICMYMNVHLTLVTIERY